MELSIFKVSGRSALDDNTFIFCVECYIIENEIVAIFILIFDRIEKDDVNVLQNAPFISNLFDGFHFIISYRPDLIL